MEREVELSFSIQSSKTGEYTKLNVKQSATVHEIVDQLVAGEAGRSGQTLQFNGQALAADTSLESRGARERNSQNYLGSYVSHRPYWAVNKDQQLE